MEDEAKVVLTVEMTPEEYVRIKKNASWDGVSVSVWLVQYATGKHRSARGC